MEIDVLSPLEIKNWKGEENYTDFFSFYKSQWLMIGTVFAALFFLVKAMTEKLEIKKDFIYIPTFVYASMIILSTVFSKNADIAVSGFVSRYEGLIALICYLVLMLITFNLVKAENQMRFLIGSLLISAAVIGIIGLFQFLGMDFFRTTLGKNLILPQEYRKFMDEVSFTFDTSTVYSTFSNPNYVGSYMALLIPMAFVSFLSFRKIYLKIAAGLLTLLLIIVLFGSHSSAGLVGLSASVLLAVILFRKKIFKRRFSAVIIIAGVLIIFIGVNFILKGLPVNKILSEFNMTVEDQFYDLKDITFGDKSVSIIGSTETLVIKEKELRLYFYDGNDNELNYNMNQNENTYTITFADELYKDYRMDLYGNILTVYQKQISFQLRIKEDGFKLIGINNEEVDNIKKPEIFGFEGKERLGSARGYIWSRTIPMLKNALLVGTGQDTFIIEFPQRDYIGRIRAYGTPQVIVDKPHNLYLQIAVNTGVLSLVAVLILWGVYLIQSTRLYIRNMENTFLKLTGASIFLAVSGYLFTSFFNDSVIGIAPVFWVLLGLGFCCNAMVSGLQQKQ